jgi:hypothetical protein
MKIALITGGQPRFTYDFVSLMSQIKGFESADLYMALWKTDWANTNEEAEHKIKKILLPNYNLSRVQLVDEPEIKLPPHDVVFDPPRPQNLLWWYKRTFCQAMGLSLAFDLVDKDYDLIIRFRLDGSLDRDVILPQLDFVNYDLVLPAGPNSGFNNDPINDQFAIGTRKGMEIYGKVGKEFTELVPLSDPHWQGDGKVLKAETWTWGLEHLLSTLFNKYNVKRTSGDFNTSINTYGRSKFTDKHFHHRIGNDPTLL